MIKSLFVVLSHVSRNKCIKRYHWTTELILLVSELRNSNPHILKKDSLKSLRNYPRTKCFVITVTWHISQFFKKATSFEQIFGNFFEQMLPNSSEYCVAILKFRRKVIETFILKFRRKVKETFYGMDDI